MSSTCHIQPCLLSKCPQTWHQRKAMNKMTILTSANTDVSRNCTGNADELIYEQWALLTYFSDKDLSNRASQHPCEVDTIIPGWVNWGTHRQSREWKLRWESRDPWCHQLLWVAFPLWRRRHLALCWKVGDRSMRSWDNVSTFVFLVEVQDSAC